ncbi:hypothetical protein [Cupriavidus sp. SW-Y-13]|nr:hypothetical protein [Cupriavidus sp. SW-Y-13]
MAINIDFPSQLLGACLWLPAPVAGRMPLQGLHRIKGLIFYLADDAKS